MVTKVFAHSPITLGRTFSQSNLINMRNLLDIQKRMPSLEAESLEIGWCRLIRREHIHQTSVCQFF